MLRLGPEVMWLMGEAPSAQPQKGLPMTLGWGPARQKAGVSWGFLAPLQALVVMSIHLN